MNSSHNISLSELCALIGGALEAELAPTYWVRAEISDIKVNNHAYIELVEKSAGDGILSAKLRATCWANTYNLISGYFFAQTQQHLQKGMQVLVEVEPAFHAVYGLSVNICNIDPQYTLGDLARSRQAAIDLLRAEGVFDMQKQLPLPSVIRRVAVISSPSAAGYQDFCHQIENSSRSLPMRLELFSAVMQGDGAESSIKEALMHVAERSDEFDVAVIIRGGGAATDMSCFDSYILAGICAQFPIPVITGIGHTRDVSVTDMVAHLSLKTPTAVAEMLIEHNAKQVQLIEEFSRRLSVAADRIILLQSKRTDLAGMRLAMLASQYINKRLSMLDLAENTIRLHSPETIFARGYSLTTLNGKPLKTVSQVRKGDVLVTELADGSVKTQVQ